jgi:type IV secretion system protein VirB10
MRLMTLALLLGLGTATFAADIPKGAHALLRMVNSVSTRTAREGDYVYLRTATPIVDDGAILVPVDSYVQGIVTQSKRSGRVKGTAELGIRIETLTMPGGKVIRMTPSLASVDGEGTDQKVMGKEGQVRQGTSHGADAVTIAGPTMMGAGIGGIADRSWKGAGIGGGAGSALGLATVLLTRGREVELRQGSTIDVIFDRPVTID